jgi:hypothetical protein
MATFFGPSGIAVGRDRVRQIRTGRFLEVFDVSITPRSSLDGHELTVDPFGDNICDSMRLVRHDQVPSRMPEKLAAALPFHFSAPMFLPWLPTAGTRRRIGKKRRGKKIEDILEYPPLRLSVSSLRLNGFARVLVDSAQDRDNLLSLGERFRLQSYYFPLKNRMDPFFASRF